MAISRVFVDTNVLFEAFRVGAWNRFGRAYSVETVGKCVEETQTGDPSACGRIDIPSQQLREGLDQIHVPSKKERATCLLQYPRLQTLDAGEQHLLVWLLSHEKLSDKTLCIATADKAAIVACGDLNCLDCVRSFENCTWQPLASHLDPPPATPIKIAVSRGASFRAPMSEAFGDSAP